jgi:hypothetical protein
MSSEVAGLLHAYRRRMDRCLADAPAELRREMLPSLAGSRVPRAHVDAVEARLPSALPQGLVEYLTGPVVEAGVEWAEIHLPSNTDLNEISGLLSQHELWAVGLMQFAYGPSGDPVCFDLAHDGGPPELPVVIINHDLCESDDWRDAGRVRQHVSATWPSFTEFLQTLCEGLPVEQRARAGRPTTA